MTIPRTLPPDIPMHEWAAFALNTNGVGNGKLTDCDGGMSRSIWIVAGPPGCAFKPHASGLLGWKICTRVQRGVEWLGGRQDFDLFVRLGRFLRGELGERQTGKGYQAQ
jgi:hypothetical protein